MKKDPSALVILTILLTVTMVGMQFVPITTAGKGYSGGGGCGGGGCGGGTSNVPSSEYEKQAIKSRSKRE